MIKTSAEYHQVSSYRRHEMTPHFLDLGNKPTVFKDYPGNALVPLPADLQLPEEKLSALLKKGGSDPPANIIGLEDLSTILRLTCSLTAKARHPGDDFYFRNVASAGALYPTEIYVATQGVDRLDDGLYHFSIRRQGLFPLRLKDLSGLSAESSPLPQNKTPRLTFFLTVIFFRSAWKYRDRSYRYHLLDTGHLTENLTLALKAVNLPFHLSYDFDDRRVNRLLGLDENREVALAITHVARDEPGFSGTYVEVEELPEPVKEASRVSGSEIDYPALREMHGAASKIHSDAQSGLSMLHELGIAPKTWVKNERHGEWPEISGYADAVFHRRSRRNFVKEPLGKNLFMSLLESLCFREPPFPPGARIRRPSIAIGFLLGRVEGMSPGFYLLDPVESCTGLVTSGLLTETMARISLDQGWLAHTSLHFLFLTNLEALDRSRGPRGYRYAMMDAGRLGERLYLNASAMGLGCCGIGAFYDEEAAQMLGVHQATRLLYLVAVGPVKSIKNF